MNKTIKTLLDHRSIRKYSSKKIEDKELEYILKSAQAAANSINGQSVSIIVVKDVDRKNKLAELAGNQGYISEAPVFLVFCMDFNRTNKASEKVGLKQAAVDSQEANIVGGIDTGLAMGNAITAAESLGLGTVCIGGVRRNPEEVIELLELPKYVFPLAGLVIGHAEEKPEQKQRFPMEVVVSQETYKEITDDQLEEYDRLISNYLSERTGGKDKSSWSERVSGVYQHVYFPKVKGALEKQGFTGEK
ncbi:oxygen-insensitive NADPH nitroreductase [Clostridium gasigenes]|uniref:oxygen-insensitive NADPH nitroreductase n=1 Tax=Clostridium gasigenes TaxID=94869 RepID=UPI0014382D1E|nr:oxygen-insensitive NADPH nitroreductase [Clostridium gasigenes]NKF05901.1 oxygen-insensitive NADPH nitroreductase [Clostridium gasigenes]QSW19371.1 oxygen-insensitive NADPH nitroreductase [Clostridium gasigenes]